MLRAPQKRKPKFEPGDRVRARPLGELAGFDGVVEARVRGDYWTVRDDRGDVWLRSDEELTRLKLKTAE